jgi:hypothetical protein
MPPWPHTLFSTSPWFLPLRPCLQELGWHSFPDAASWQALPDTLRPRTRSGLPVQFIAPALLDAQPYELRIATRGEVATRPANWHDAFNALSWLVWPHSKAALNALHLREMAREEQGQRGRSRDAVTLFDESGLVLACADARLQAALLEHDWTTLFQTRAASWGEQIAAFSFGHALLEKGLAPFIGIVGKVMLVEVAPDWFQLPLEAQLRDLDQQLAARLDQAEALDPRSLPPLPVLGIPGWWPQQDAAFYADTRHFRPRRPVVHPG